LTASFLDIRLKGCCFWASLGCSLVATSLYPRTIHMGSILKELLVSFPGGHRDLVATRPQLASLSSTRSFTLQRKSQLAG